MKSQSTMKTVTPGEKLKAKRQKQILPLPTPRHLQSCLEVRALLKLWYPGQYDYFYFLDEKIRGRADLLFGLRSNPTILPCSVLQGINHCKPHILRFLEN